MKTLLLLLSIAACAAAQEIPILRWPLPLIIPTAPQPKPVDQLGVNFGDLKIVLGDPLVTHTYDLAKVPAAGTRVIVCWTVADRQQCQFQIVPALDPLSTDVIRKRLRLWFPPGSNSGTVNFLYESLQ